MGAEGASEATSAGLIAAGVLEIGDGYRAKLSDLGGSGPLFLRAGLGGDEAMTFGGSDRFKEELGPGL